VTSAEAKGIITKPHTRHVCYCLTPTRYLWSGYREYQESPGWGILNRPAHAFHAAMTPVLRRWDLIASARPDAYIAISNRVAARMKKFYGRTAIATIYPPVDPVTFDVNSPCPDGLSKNGYYLIVSRLVGYKRLDVIVDAFREIRRPLVIIGTGVQKRELMRRSAPNIRFVDRYLTDQEIAGYYGNCRAYVFVGEEDFGLSAVEAQACGRPVVAYKESGISEIIEDGVTGILLSQRSIPALRRAFAQLESQATDADACRRNALRFSLREFQHKMRETVETYHDSHLPI
jgi:glycosyltransferase involved in cell wall biosynthesis